MYLSLLALLRKSSTENGKPNEALVDYFFMGAVCTALIAVFAPVILMIAGVPIFILSGSLMLSNPPHNLAAQYASILPVFSAIVLALYLILARGRPYSKALLSGVLGSIIMSVLIADIFLFDYIIHSTHEIVSPVPPALPLFLIIIAAEEVLFWMDGEKLPRNKSRISFTIQKKFEAFFDVGIGAIMYLYGAALGYLATSTNVLTQVGEFVLFPFGAAILVAAFIYGNSLKYKK
jgi:hypothetical protein